MFETESSQLLATTEEGKTHMSDPHLSQQLTQMMTGHWISRVVYVAAKLRIADRLANGPCGVEKLATAAEVAPRPLYRILRRPARIA
jgi:hypothetical protein